MAPRELPASCFKTTTQAWLSDSGASPAFAHKTSAQIMPAYECPSRKREMPSVQVTIPATEAVSGQYNQHHVKLPFIYIFLALIATTANIASQSAIIHIYSGPFSMTISMLIGTGIGLIIKYVLDKRYIFMFRAHDAVHDSRTFALYTLMGIVTTIIFWGIEYGFDHAFGTMRMRYVGAALGLALGYVIKYYLDKNFVFGPSRR